MTSPRYLRQNTLTSGAGTDYEDALVPYVNRENTVDTTDSKIIAAPATLHNRNTEDLNVTGLRQKRLIALIIWLTVLSILSIILFSLNFTLIKVLQMTTQGMKSLKIHSYVDKKTGEMESAVHFQARNIDLGHIIAKSGKVIGPRNKRLTIQGSRIIINTNTNVSRFSMHNGNCKLENTDQFQVISGINGKVLFNANHPLITVDQRIKQIAAKTMVTTKIRAPINEELRILTKNVNLRGNEAIQFDARLINATAKTSFLLKTSKDGAVRFNARHVYIGNQWRPLAVSPSPALTASIDAFRLCICSTSRRKLFIVSGNKPCKAPSTICN